MYDMSRGWSGDNLSSNYDYYLFNKAWYFIMSPLFIDKDNQGIILRINSDGHINGVVVNDSGCGVRKVLQNVVLMCLICLKMDYEKEKRPKIKFVKFGSLQCR